MRNGHACRYAGARLLAREMYRRNASCSVSAVTWLLSGALAAAGACGGGVFSGDGPVGGGSNAQAGEAAGSSPGSQGGDATGVPSGGAVEGGEPSLAEAGAPGAAGAGGMSGTLDCSALNGQILAEHCYADVTVESVTQVDAATACAALTSKTGSHAQLLVLDSPAEQSFIVENFLSEVTDAWLGLTCSSTKHADLGECFCVDCEDALLLQKRAVWSWLDGSSSTFGWSGNNPDGGGRCSALAFNPTTERWGWVDRPCLSTSHQLTGFTPHSYRVICELW